MNINNLYYLKIYQQLNLYSLIHIILRISRACHHMNHNQDLTLAAIHILAGTSDDKYFVKGRNIRFPSDFIYFSAYAVCIKWMERKHITQGGLLAVSICLILVGLSDLMSSLS